MAGTKGDKSSSKSAKSPVSKDFQLKILPKEKGSSTKVKNSKTSEHLTDRSGNASRISMADLEFSDASPVKREKRKGFTGKHEAKKRPEPVRGASSSSELSDSDEEFSNKQPLAASSTKALGKLPSVRKTASSSDESSFDNDDEKLKNWGNESSSESDGKESKSNAPVKDRKSTNSRNKVVMPTKLLGTHQTELDLEPDINDSDEDDNVDAGNDLGGAIKVDDLRAGNAVCMKMSREDLASFVEKMKEHGSVLEKVTEAAKFGKIKWNDLAFNGYSGQDLKNAWAFLRKSRRRQRNLWEVANELEHELKLRKNYKETWLAHHPDMPIKPPGYSSPAHVFTHQQYLKEKAKLKADQKLPYLEFQKKCFQDFTRLSEKKKALCTQKWEQLRETYQKSLSEFYKSVGYDPIEKKDRLKKSKSRIGGEGLKAKSKTLDMFPDAPKPPPTPMDCYASYRMSKLSDPPLPAEMDELASLKASEYLQLKNSKKAKYINRAVKAFEQYQKDVEEYQKIHPDYPAPKNVKLASLLTKEEIEDWENSHGRPEKPPVSVVGFLERDLIEKGELNPDTYVSDVAMRKAVEEKLKKLSYYDRQSYEIQSRQAEMEYFKAINEYYENLPAVMKPLILPSIDKKFRAPAAMRDSPVKTPKKRKLEATVMSSEQSEDTKASTKKKRTKNEINEIAQAEIHVVEEAISNADAIPKEKTSRALIIVLRGIFDGKPSLGRTFSALYYFSRDRAVESFPAEKFADIGIVNAALHIMKEFRALSRGQMTNLMQRCGKLHSKEHFLRTKNGRIKQELAAICNDKDSELHLLAPLRFELEPQEPPLNPQDLYYREVAPWGSRKRTLAWKNLATSVKFSYMQKHFRQLKCYAKDFEAFVMSLTPSDLAEYTTAKAATWEQNFIKCPDKMAKASLPIIDVESLRISECKGLGRRLKVLDRLTADEIFPIEDDVRVDERISSCDYENAFDNSDFLSKVLNASPDHF